MKSVPDQDVRKNFNLSGKTVFRVFRATAPEAWRVSMKRLQEEVRLP
jgi:hypothetical protein